MVTTASDLASQIIAYEAGELDTVGFLVFFAELIRTGSAFTLEGSHGLIAIIGGVALLGASLLGNMTSGMESM